MSTILLIDAHTRFVERAVTLLRGRDHRVIAAVSGDEGHARLASGPAPDLVVVDERLLETSGMAWIERMRGDGFTMPVILVLRPTPGIDPPPAFMARYGIAFILRKPIEDDFLIDAVESVLARTTLSRQRRTLSSMQADYATRLPSRLAELVRALDELRDGVHEGSSVEEARILAHRMRGTAGAFGFAGVGDDAAVIEEALAHAVGPDVSARAAAWEAIDAALADARALRKSEPVPTEIPARSPSESRMLSTTPSGDPADWRSESIPSAGATTRVLVVDDDPTFSEYIDALGRRKLVSVIHAATPSDALQKARELRPDAAMIDVHLGPSQLSFALAGQLRAIPGCEEIRIAFISSAAHLDARVAAARAGATLYLTKPIDATAFDLALQQLLASREVPQNRVVALASSVASGELTRAILEGPKWSVRVVATPAALLAALDEQKPDLVLADAHHDAFDACRAIRTSLRWRDLSIVFLADHEDPSERFEALESGGDDYVVRTLPRRELTMRFRMRVDRVRVAREVAGRDRLTGLVLRGTFLDLLAARVSEAQRHKLPLSIALIDLDHFKAVNDEHGHLAGDQVLLGLGKLLSTRLRTEDLRARWGGEEFIVAFPGEGSGSAYLMFTRILNEFSQIAFTGAQGERFTVTFSAGIAALGEDAGEIESLIGVADRRLYSAKRRGRNRIAFRG